jgi:hypothetical protein
MNGDFFLEWRAADRAAHAFEKLLAKDHMNALNGLGPTPPAEATRQAHQLRAAANALFTKAMAQMQNREGHSRW